MTIGIHDILDEMRAVKLDERHKGDMFEKAMQAYLKTEPQYQQLYSEVWLWSEFPEREGKPDTGIDLVAKNRDDDGYTAIQCKFYDPSTVISKGDVDTFLSSSSKEGYTGRLIISTTDNWGKNAEESLERQSPPVQRIRVADLDESSIDWSKFSIRKPSDLTRKAKKQLRPHQVKAVGDVISGFKSADRGKLVMACGTGKTFTSLRLVEQMVPDGGTALLLVPSISLLSQSLKEWTIEAERPMRSFAVCSDVSVGKRKDEEDIPITDGTVTISCFD